MNERRARFSELCLNCGLCCSGALFDVVPLEAAEVPVAERLRLPLADSRYFDAFTLPCAWQHGRGCSIHTSPDRPKMCGEYECGVLGDYESGTIEFDEAMRRVRAAAELIDAIQLKTPGWPARRGTVDAPRPSDEDLQRWRELRRDWFER